MFEELEFLDALLETGIPGIGPVIGPGKANKPAHTEGDDTDPAQGYDDNCLLGRRNKGGLRLK